MAVRPSVPSNFPAVGSEWFCQTSGGWPGWWKQTVRWGSKVVITDSVWISNRWKIRFNVVSNSTVVSVGNTETVDNFYTFFGTQPLLVAKLAYYGSGSCDLRRLEQTVRGFGRVMSKGYGRPLVLHALSATGGGSSTQERLQPYRID